MFKKIDTKKDLVNNFSTSGDILFYQKVDDVNLYQVKDEGGKSVLLEEKYMDLNLDPKPGHVLVVLESGKGVLLDKNLKKLPILQGVKYSCKRNFNDLIPCYKGGLFDRKNGVYSIIQEKILFEVEEILGVDVFSDRIYDESNKTIICRDIKTGEINWKFPLAPYGSFTRNGEELPVELTKFLGEHNGVMYLLAGNKLILGVDVISGQEVYKFQYNEDIGGLMNVELDAENNSIFSLGPNHYVDITLDDPTCKVYDISASMKKHQLEGYRLGSWEKNLVYFYEGGSSNRFGVFDRHCKEVIWSDEIEEVKEQPAPILKLKHGGNKLYVYDFLKTLHIFEKE